MTLFPLILSAPPAGAGQHAVDELTEQRRRQAADTSEALRALGLHPPTVCDHPLGIDERCTATTR